MTTSSTPPSDPPLPLLPMELKREILRFCGPSTLASTSPVSLAFFQLSSPLLYQHLTIRRFSNLGRLFRTYISPIPHPHLDIHLDLKQIKSFTFLVDFEDPGDADSTFSPEGRLPSSGNLFIVETLDIEIVPKSPTWPCPFLPLLSLFNPITVRISGTSSTMAPDESFAYLEVHPLEWDRLRSVTFLNVGLTGNLRFACFVQGSERITVIHDVNNRWPYVVFAHLVDSIANALDDVFGTEGGDGEVYGEFSLLTCSSLDRMVFRVCHEEQSGQICGWIRYQWREQEVGFGKQQRWAELVEFEEVDTGTRRCMSSIK